MARRVLKQSRVLITGASSGIGRSLALELAGHQARLLLTARRAEHLARLAEQVSDGEVHTAPGDVADDAHRQELVRWIRQHWGALDVLVNNAGIGAIGPFCQASPERLRRVMEVNFFAAVELTRACLPLLEQGRDPAIVNIGSVLAHVAVPLKSEYCASKFALRGWSDALRAELTGQGIQVLMVHPSTTSTEFFDQAIDRQQPARRSRWSMPSEKVARATVAALVKGHPEVILSRSGRVLVWGSRITPAILRRLVGRFARSYG
jgi:short-subunit dehydrogenase